MNERRAGWLRIAFAAFVATVTVVITQQTTYPTLARYWLLVVAVCCVIAIFLRPRA